MTLSTLTRRMLQQFCASAGVGTSIADKLDAGDTDSLTDYERRRLAFAMGSQVAANKLADCLSSGDDIPDWVRRKLVFVGSQFAGDEIGDALDSVSGWVSGSLSADITSATEGNDVTFSYSGVGATSYQLYRDGRYLLNGTTMPFTLSNIGVQDAGTYTLYAEGPGGSTTTSGVAVTVAANNIVTDNFTGSVSAQWNSTTGTPDLTSNRFNCNAASASAVYVQKTISNDDVRFQFTINANSLSSGTAECFELGAANPICKGLLIYSGGTIYLRISTNVNGPYWPAQYYVNYVQATGYAQPIISGDTKVEIRWKKYVNGTAKGSWWVYLNDQFHCCVIEAGDNGTYFPAAATYLRIGKLNASSDGAGTYYFDSVQVKQGAVASNAFTAGSKLAGIWMGGQSNAAGADTGSYSAVTDSIGSKGVFSLNVTDTPETSPRNLLFMRREIATASPSPSANIAYTFIQNIDLPAGYAAFANMNAIGSTGFNTNPGWGTTYPLYRDLSKTALTFAQHVFEHYTNIALLWHQGEADAGNDDYQTYLSTLISELRAITGENTPFIAGGLSPEYLTGGSLYDPNYLETTNDIEELMGSIVNGGFASSVSPTAASVMASQKIHFDGAGYRTMGDRYADAYLTLVPRATP